MNVLSEKKGFVGKRILVCDNEETESCDKLRWQCGIIRCASSNNLDDSDFMIYIEWDGKEGQDWKKLEDFKNVFIEQGITVTEHFLSGRLTAALIFHQRRGFQLPTDDVLVEFLNDRHRAFVKEENIRTVEKEDELLVGTSGKTRDAVNDWLMVQRAQKILADRRSCLTGSRILVFRDNSSIKWFNALIIRSDGNLLHIMNEQVLTETTVDPSLAQIRFLNPNFVRDIINGDVDSAARRSRRSTRSSSCNALDLQKGQKRGAKRKSVLHPPMLDAPSKIKATSQCTKLPDSPQRDALPSQTINAKPPLCLSKSAPTSSVESRDNNAQLPHTPPPDCDATMIDAAQSLVNISCKYKQEAATSSAASSSHVSFIPAPSSRVSLSTSFSLVPSFSLSSSLPPPPATFSTYSPLSASSSFVTPVPASSSRVLRHSASFSHVPSLSVSSLVPPLPASTSLVPPHLASSSHVPPLLASSFCTPPVSRSSRADVVTSQAPTIHAPKPILAHKPLVTHVITSPIMTPQSNFVPNSQSGSFEAYRKPCSKTKADDYSSVTMHHHSQHSRQLTALAAQQALIQQNQQQNQQQQQQQQSQQLSQPQMITPHQLIANPYLNPYGLQLFYGNPALSGSLNASTLVQAQLQAAAVAAASNRTVAPQTMMPWIKDQLEKDLQHTQQQQALYAALWRNKPPEEIASALYRAESGGSSSPKTSQSSPGMEPTKSGHTLSKDDKVPERSHSQKSLPRSSSPRRSHDINGSLPRPFPTPREQTQTSSPVGQGSYPKPPAQPQTYKSVIMKERDHILRLQQEERWKLEEAQARKLQELEREVKRQEDMWRAKITKNPTSNRNDATKKFTGEKERSSQLKQSTRGEKTSSVWGVQHPVPQSIAQIPLTMIDPATFVAAHASKLINDETVLQNGSSDVERNTSSSKTSMSHLEPPRHKYPPSSSSQSVSSRKIWQPPVIPPKPVSSSEKSSLLKPPLKSSEPSPGNLSSSYKGYRLPAPSSVPVKPSNNHVVNIHSLKYSPPSSSPKPRTAASPRSHSEKTVVVKTSPVTSHSDAQTVKYISDRGQASHLAPNRSPTPPLGPLMADGSRARILSEASLRNLYHFPGPLSKPEPKATEATSENVSDQVIINEPHYKVTALTGNHDNTAKVTSTPPSHLVYAKPAMTLRTDMTSREGSPSIGAKEDNEMEVKNVRKRSRNSDDADPSKKMCKEESRVYFPRYNAASHATANLPDVVSTADPVLRELVANGIFGVTTSSIIWRDPTQVVDQYPGTPSKVALKGALMGLKADNGWNLSSSDSTHGASPSSVPTEERGPPSNIPTDERGPPSIQSHSSLNVFPTTSDQQKLPIVCPSKLNQESSNVEPESPSSRHSAPPSKPFDLSLNPLQQSMGPSATVPATVDTSNYKPFAGGSSNSPASDVSAVSDLSWGSNKVKTPSSDSSGTKSAAPPKLKKAWLKRMSDEPNDPAKDSVKCSSPEELPTSPLVIISYPGTPVEEKPPSEPPSPHDDSLDPPSKKSKKKHRNKEKKHKDPDRKKRKHKEGKKSRKSDSDCPTDVCSPSLGSAGMKEGPEDSSLKVLSNSKLFLMGQLDHSEDEVDDSVEGGDIKKSKKKSGAKKIRSEMPTGENGLPISVLLCRKEQARLKRLGEPFMQDAPCHEIIAMNGIATQTLPSGLSSVPKCRECGNAKRKDNSTVFCRFYGFRKLAFINGILHASGFCDPEDSRLCDVRLWLPTMGKSRDSNNKPSLELETCRYIMKHIGGKFCELVRDEKEELTKAALNEGIRWKRPVSGVREMCDACETTLFNLHWVCHKCGFAVCSDCYKIRRGMSVSELEAYDADRNHLYRWMTCTRGKHHAPSQLVPTQIIPSSCLFDLCELAHQACARWSITSQCRCKKGEFFHTPRPTDPTPLLKNHCNSALLSHSAGKVTSSKPDVKTSVNRDSNRFKSYDCESSASPLDWLASIALREQRKSSVASSSIVTSSLVKGIGSEDKTPGKETGKVTLSQQRGGGLLATSSKAAPRSWLCNGQLLQLTDSTSEVNVDTFQLHWFYGMPVMASGASNNLNRDLWRPETFSREHGDESTGSALINCKRGSIITNAFIKDFWNGFESIENRLRDERSGERMILKLKDWPTTEDFIDTMPDKYEDLMRGLPLPQYTARDGKFNMAAHLPDFFVRPDLGPKMYIAYGWVSESDWSQGTTNLHLDISDACNLMVYVGIPNDEPTGAQDALIKIIKEGDADAAQIERAKTHKAGALWHIFKASDTDKIRKLILKVKAEKGILVSEDHDPIHDQQIYLDQTLRRRLREEYGVEGYPLVQCEGDSVFIPAGAPHQVFNLHSCIKVAEDFVSPEHVDKCFKLTEEFRRLSTAHSNHEDKLQLKNIIFHTMKEIVASLSWHEANGGLETGMEAKAAPED